MDGMSIRQFRELELFYAIESFGEYRDELRNGKILAMIANINRDPDKKPTPFTAHDFMNFVEEPEERIYTQEELEAYADKVFQGNATVQ